MKKINKYDRAHNITLKHILTTVWCGNDIVPNITLKIELQPK